MRSETKKLMKVAKSVVPRNTRKKIKKLPKDEKNHLYEHSIKSNLEMRMHYIDMALRNYNDESDYFLINAKFDLLKSKVRYLFIDFDKKDLNHVVKLVREIEKRLDRNALKSVKKLDAELNKFIKKE